ncbi:hypothetical protein LPB72_07170 [Hydrogenophaga crassostreae]|uniref:Uncharacterized protein n=1 Tax=Hydrogenophaga crassostreae TaxID=1763535 RepID=A0A167IFY9_9BURK|nr:hypothetical protein [Hydrogenophaga crassostreae]AOW13172.1 hypothetical protein LPB072_10205 [Hydrogenophaga crassostreae]OAD42682.1 hypothetical protein LPB72_07170 [Hydrogenophaga crassostreae]
MARASRCHPKALSRAARDHRSSQSDVDVALQCGLGALHGMSMGHGYEPIAADVQKAQRLAIARSKPNSAD